MKRSTHLSLWAMRTMAFTIVFCSFVVLTSHAHAGDIEGINGYSMRLKQKDSSDGYGGGSNLVTEETELRARIGEQPYSAINHHYQRERLVGWNLVRHWMWTWFSR